MTVYNHINNFNMALATGDDSGAGAGLTAWRNADTKFAVGELIPADVCLGWSYKPATYETSRYGTMTSSRVSARTSMARRVGEWKSKHAFQTCQFIWWLMQTAGTPTNEGTPAGYNTHTITISASSDPIWHGIHFEREGITSNELNYDLMGLLPYDLTISCANSGDLFDAQQDLSCQFVKKVDGDNIVPQTRRPYNVVGTKWKTWDNLTTGNGGGKSSNMTGLLYNSGSLEVDVISNSVSLSRTPKLYTPDTGGVPTIGRLHDFDYSVTLDVKPVGDALYSLNHIAKEDYADLDFAFSYVSDATNDKITFTFDKMYLVPFDELNDYNTTIEGYTITLEPLDETSSLTVVGIDGLDNEHFENP